MGKQLLILAGPNGAGKTTFAREFLVTEANCPTFLNADIIAAELSPQHPEQVGYPEEVVRRRFVAGRANFDNIRTATLTVPRQPLRGPAE